MEEIARIVVLTALVEGTVEYFAKPVAALDKYIAYIACALGVAVAFAYRIDILSALGAEASYPYVGYVLSGIIMGRGSNYVSDFLSLVRAKITKLGTV